MTETAAVPALSPAMSFEEASDAVIEYLKVAVPMRSWAVTRYDGTNQVYLAVRDDGYGLEAGDSFPWSVTFCQYAVTDQAPRIAPDAMGVPLYAGSPSAQTVQVGAYIGYPIRTADGELFGTLCGLDLEVGTPEMEAHRPLLELLSMLLGTVLQADLVRAEQTRQLERVALLAESDALTGLVNRRGWEKFIAQEEDRYRRFGDPGSVIIIDLDGLKQVNDSGGHAAGDRYIVRAAETLRNCVRQTDLLARLGGDEFGVLAARTTVQEAEHLVTRLRACLDESGVPASVGHAAYTFVAGFPGAWEPADTAMYLDKRRRRAGS